MIIFIPPRPKFGVLIPNYAEIFPGSPRRVGGRDSLPRGQAPEHVWAELFALWKAQPGLISPLSRGRRVLLRGAGSDSDICVSEV